MAITLYDQARTLVESGVSMGEASAAIAVDPTGLQPWPSAEVEDAILLEDQLAHLLAGANDEELAAALTSARGAHDELMADAIEAEAKRRASA